MNLQPYITASNEKKKLHITEVDYSLRIEFAQKVLKSPYHCISGQNQLQHIIIQRILPHLLRVPKQK